MCQYLMGIDNGGTVTKACIFDARGTEVATASKKLPILTPAPGHTERDLNKVWQANCEAICQVIQKKEFVECYAKIFDSSLRTPSGGCCPLRCAF